MKRYPLITAFLLVSTGALADPTLTRVEPRPYYGSTIQVEQGIRVIRPLPPHGQIIIDPGMGYGWGPPVRLSDPPRPPIEEKKN